MPMDRLPLTRILMISNDISLASSSANLLIQAGHSVDLEVKVERALQRSCSTPYDLVVVSNNFSRTEQVAIRARFKQTRPEQRVLLLGHRAQDPAEFLESVAASLRSVPKSDESDARHWSLASPSRPT